MLEVLVLISWKYSVRPAESENGEVVSRFFSIVTEIKKIKKKFNVG